MIYMGDASWWDNRFDARGAKLMMHDSKLEEDMKYFPEKGKVLDVACGDGRNSIFLSKRGYEVEILMRMASISWSDIYGRRNKSNFMRVNYVG